MNDKAVKRIIRIDHHRNGVSGEPFYIVLFHGIEYPKNQMVAILFEETGQCAVLDTGETHKGNTGFAEGNSWRGDYYEYELRQAIEKWEKQRHDRLMATGHL